MPLKLTAQKYDSPFNPTRLFASVTFSGSYTAGGDTLDLTPSKMADPAVIGLLGPNAPPKIAPGIFSENLGGYYANVIPGTTLANYKLKLYAPGGTELAAGAYPGAITAGSLVLEIPFENY